MIYIKLRDSSAESRFFSIHIYDVVIYTPNYNPDGTKVSLKRSFMSSYKLSRKALFMIRTVCCNWGFKGLSPWLPFIIHARWDRLRDLQRKSKSQIRSPGNC